jgi:adenosylcobyric acid synthase
MEGDFLKRAKPIMIQGTMSNVGKSLLAAGLCRVFKQDGYRVAPFKAQNMALNSFITKENLEMGRAQVVQAEACGIEPSVNMNPILLKPTTDMGSQVIVNGEVVGNMRAMDYFKRKKDYIPVIEKAYDELAEEYDIIVIEGAGSPAEINLKQDDIVNMGMAKIADAPVLLAGDIDRGGVFAQLIGTVALLEPEEQDRIKGLIVNKFRGDPKILEPGLAMITERCHKKVLGVVPYMDVDIEEEDSLAQRLDKKNLTGELDLAVIRLPKLSNFTDFQALAMEPGVSIRYVDQASGLGHPDVILLPGTKNTIQDMKWLRQSGLEAAIKKRVSKGTLLFGICGGYQMLGEQILDTQGIEGEGTLSGFGMIPMVTQFEPEKTRTQISGTTGHFTGIFAPLSDKKVRGYEIHMGKTSFTKEVPSLLQLHGKKDGYCSDHVMGTYLHGIFDEEEFRRTWIRILCEKKGISFEENEQSFEEYKQQQYDKLADILRDSLNLEEIYRIIGC